jgi:putative ABC transport system permease protein
VLTGRLARLAVRQLASHPWQLGLAILGIALGVAVAVSIDLANGSALRAFRLSTEAVGGRATHQVVGGPSGLPEDVYRRLRLELGVRRAAPVVEGDVAVAGRAGRTLHVLGIDPFADADFRPYLDSRGPGETRGRTPLARAEALVGRGGTALLAAATARDLGLEIGNEVAIDVAGVRRTLAIVGLLRPADAGSARALEDLLVTDIATAQELFGAAGRLTRIDLIVGDAARLARIREALPPGADLVGAGAQAGATARMILAFQWNLTALSLLALVVGMFLIYQTMTF